MRFTLKQLEYFVAAGETGSITRAAERVSISQPSISTAIAQLEKELNAQLFIRHHAQGLSLTPVGRTLLAEARRVLENAETLYGVASEANEDLRGSLSLGCLITIAPMILSELTLSFTAAYPGAVVEPRLEHQERILQGLRHAAIDLAVTYDLALSDDIDFLPLAKLPVHALVGEEHPLAHRSSVSLAELSEQPMVFLDLPMSSEYFHSLFMAEGLTPKIAYRIEHLDVIRTMVANGFGYTLANVAPRSDLALDGRKVIRIPVSGNHHPMTIGLARLKAREKTRLMTAFQTHVQTLISDSYIPGMVAPAG